MKLFNTLKNYFKAPAFPNGGGSSGITQFELFGEDDMKATIYTQYGTSSLFSPTGEHVGSYSRARDAKRGARRRGWTVA